MAIATRNNRMFYGWFILATSFVIAFLAMGIRNGFGVFVIPLTEEFGWSRGTISLAISIGLLVDAFSQPFLGRLYDRFGARILISVCVSILGIGTILLSQTNSIWFLIAVYGFFMSMAASGASFVTIHAMLSKWFFRKRGLALSVSTAGASGGSLVLTPFVTYLILLADWRIAWFVLGAMLLLIALPMALFFLKDNPSDVGQEPDGDSAIEAKSAQQIRDIGRGGPLAVDSWMDSYKSPPMWQLTAGYFVCGVTTLMISAHYIPFAIGRGISPGTAALAFGLMSFLNIIGVVVVGMLADKVSRKKLLGLMYGIRFFAYVMLLFAPGALGIWGFALIAGVSWIATAPLTASLTADIYGLKKIGTLNGMATLAHQVGGAISVSMAGFLYDALGSYMVPFSIAGSMLAFAAIASFAIREKSYSSRYVGVSGQSGAGIATAGGDAD